MSDANGRPQDAHPADDAERKAARRNKLLKTVRETEAVSNRATQRAKRLATESQRLAALTAPPPEDQQLQEVERKRQDALHQSTIVTLQLDDAIRKCDAATDRSDRLAEENRLIRARLQRRRWLAVFGLISLLIAIGVVAFSLMPADGKRYKIDSIAYLASTHFIRVAAHPSEDGQPLPREVRLIFSTAPDLTVAAVSSFAYTNGGERLEIYCAVPRGYHSVHDQHVFDLKTDSEHR